MFFFVIYFSNTLYSLTWVIISILSIWSCFCEKIGLWSIEITKVVCGLLRSPRVVCDICDHQELFVVYCDHQVCNPSLLWVCFHPSGIEVIVVWLCTYPSCVEVIIVWLYALSLLCRGGCVGERSCILQVYNWKFLGGGSVCGRSCVDVVEILLCEARM